MRTIYFDYNATTPLDSAVREAMLPHLGEVYGNPSSVHHVGRRARAILDEARDRTAQVFQCKPSEVVFTSGGTESDNLAIFGAARLRREKGKHIISSRIEHHAVLHALEYLEKQEGYEITYLPVGEAGNVATEDLGKAIRADTVLVTLMAANNETGAIQPVAEMGEICRSRGVLFHTDAVQWFGKEEFRSIEQFKADLVSVCSHKLHGPKGAGALFIRSPLLPHPILFGGGHENERRAGTENLANIVGFAETMERFVKEPVFEKNKMRALTSELLESVERIEGVQYQGAKSNRLSNTLSFTVEGSDSIALLAGLDLEGICASSGSACSAGSIEPSHVMVAMGAKHPNSLIRFSLGRENTKEEVNYVKQVLPEVIRRARS